ncbi:gliding motility protein GldC [Marinoscillum pacificum]|uniref:gliding motility protein GldC n=1 Tax=Marinoscillum pacificum TaxID=392723 RepID=UPI00215795C1|nr:gliding motility protein GldC [Marinoscillum pacificum]
MKKSEIKISVELDEQNIPETIMWDADEKQGEGPSETKSVSLSLWDDKTKNTLRIDLWAKDMPVEDMKRFYIDCIGGMAQSILNSTGDEYMASELNAVCDKFVTHLKNEMS